MKPIPLVRVSSVLPSILSLQRVGAPVHRYLRQAKIPEQVLESTELSIPLHTVFNFYRISAHAEGLESLGLAFTSSYHISNLGVVGKILGQALTLYDALCQLCSISKKVSTGQTYWIVEQARQILFCERFDKLPSSCDAGVYGATHYAFALMLNYIRKFLGADWEPPDVYVATPPFRHFRQEFQLEATRIHFNHPHLAICVPRKLMALEPSAKRLPLLQFDNLDVWRESTPKQDFVGSLEQTLATLFLDGYPSIELTAEAVDLSVRTLQRNLSKQGLSYSRLVDRVRYQQAVSFMQNQDIPLIEVAYSLGYSDPANFSHAFKRWTGVAPRQYRQLNASHPHGGGDSHQPVS
ncbi:MULTISPECIES: AraC family transcriptional regulator [Aphanothece]|uniref:AraC family transcriptional regulator n=1 Tax=Aphanothece TaxID=1121 RepID=UPI003984CDC0